MKQHERTPDPSELESLASYLQKNQNVILAEWQDKVQKKGTEQPSKSASASQGTFYNDISSFLQQLCKNFRNIEAAIEQPARRQEEKERAYRLDLRGIISGWILFHRILADHLNRAQESIDISPDSLTEVHRRLPQGILKWIQMTVNEYYRLQRREVETQIQDLETVIRQQSTQQGQREVNLHQISHDLKGSMTALRMNLDFLQRVDLDNQARRIADRLSVAADSLTQLLENLLDLSRLEVGREELEVSKFDVAELLGSLCESMQSMAEAKGLELRCKGENTLHVRGDRMRVRRIAQNLLQNALKYTKKGYVEMGWKKQSADRWMLTVRDTGPGLDSARAASFNRPAPGSGGFLPEEPPAISSHQKTAKEWQHSEGIGLIIVRQLCHLLDGEVEVKSGVEAGTHFRIVFPADYSSR